jgi:ADP-ribose pyrophosphatase YjhB (NUDIX family)
MMLSLLCRSRLLKSSRRFCSTASPSLSPVPSPSPSASIKDTFCSYCGTRHTNNVYPLTCPSCQTITYSNPIPVSVVLVPVEIDNKIGLLVGKRNIQPKKGKFTFFGGFVEMEDTMEAGVRELKEESGLEIKRDRLLPFWFTSTEPKPNRVLLFSLHEDVLKTLPPFVPNSEISERGVIFGTEGLSEIMAFPLHVEAAKKFFSTVRDHGPTGYKKV